VCLLHCDNSSVNGTAWLKLNIESIVCLVQCDNSSVNGSARLVLSVPGTL
jgi:hypothetical protein